jgi:hypothetical protein
MPEGTREAFPEIAWSSVTVSQAAGPVDMIIGRDNPELEQFSASSAESEDGLYLGAQNCRS